MYKNSWPRKPDGECGHCKQSPSNYVIALRLSLQKAEIKNGFCSLPCTLTIVKFNECYNKLGVRGSAVD